MSDAAREAEVEGNFSAFLHALPKLLISNRNQFALMRHQVAKSIHPRLSDALRTGHELFTDGIFSVQQITDEPVDLGYFSHVGFPGE